jgi:hypothetical protein
MQLAAVQGPHEVTLPFAATSLLQRLFQGIARVEMRELLAEVALAGQVPPDKLATVPRQALEAAVAALGAPLSLSALYPQA